MESHGYERPGYFEQRKPQEEPSSSDHFRVKPYDYLGAYGHTPHSEHLYASSLQQLCSFDVHRQWEGEHHSCRNAVAVFDTSAFGKLRVEAPDAAAAMEWLCTNHVAKPAGATTYTALCNAAGRVEADLTVSSLGEEENEDTEGGAFTCALAARPPRVTLTTSVASLRRAIRRGALRSERRDWHINIKGRRAGRSLRGYATALSTLATPPSPSRPSAPASLGLLLLHHHLLLLDRPAVGRDEDAAVRIAMEELGWELHIPKASAAAVYRQLMAMGADLGVKNAGYLATGSLSLEKGYRHWGSDLRCTDTPMAAGLGHCKFKSGVPFLGRDALVAEKAKPHKNLNGRVAYFTAGHVADSEPEIALHGHEPLYRDGHFAGFLRTTGYGFSINASIGYAYVLPPDSLHGEGIVSLEYLKQGELMRSRRTSTAKSRRPSTQRRPLTRSASASRRLYATLEPRARRRGLRASTVSKAVVFICFVGMCGTLEIDQLNVQNV